jgi:hypothetical protein
VLLSICLGMPVCPKNFVVCQFLRNSRSENHRNQVVNEVVPIVIYFLVDELRMGPPTSCAACMRLKSERYLTAGGIDFRNGLTL